MRRARLVRGRQFEANCTASTRGCRLFEHHGTKWVLAAKKKRKEGGRGRKVVGDCGRGCVLIVVDRQIVVEGWVRLGRTEGGGSGRKERGREG